MLWVRRLFQRRRLERELDKELRFHVEQHAADLIARGLDPGEARRQARLALGGPEQVKEECRDARGTMRAEGIWKDIRFAWCTLWRSPGFALATIVPGKYSYPAPMRGGNPCPARPPALR
jgi:hypothetical protein